MAIVKSDAILLNKMELRETSILLDFYTKESGKIRGVVKGVRSPQPQFGALFEVFSLDRIMYYETKNKDIFTISQCELLDYFPDLRSDLERLGYAFYYTELVNTTSQIGERNASIFDLLLDSLVSLSQKGSAKRITRVFEIKLLKLLGMLPEFRKCVKCGKTSLEKRSKFSVKNGGILCEKCLRIDLRARPVTAGTLNFMEHVALTPMEKVGRIKVSKEVGKEVEKLLRDFLGYHIDRKFKSIRFMQEVGIL